MPLHVAHTHVSSCAIPGACRCRARAEHQSPSSWTEVRASTSHVGLSGCAVALFICPFPRAGRVAHTPLSAECCFRWFQVRASRDSCACVSRVARFQSMHMLVQKHLPENTRNAALIFNCGHVRDPIPLLWWVQGVLLDSAGMSKRAVGESQWVLMVSQNAAAYAVRWPA